MEVLDEFSHTSDMDMDFPRLQICPNKYMFGNNKLPRMVPYWDLNIGETW